MLNAKNYILYVLIGFWLVAQNEEIAQTEPETKAELFTAKMRLMPNLLGTQEGMPLSRDAFQKTRMKLVAKEGFSMLYRKG